MLCPLPFGFAFDTQNGQDAPKTIPIDLALAARTEPLKPACSMTSAHSPQAKPWKTAAYLIKQQVPDYRWQLCFCKRLRVPTPRHVSFAAINPVETVTPPRGRPSVQFPRSALAGASRSTGSCCSPILPRIQLRTRIAICSEKAQPHSTPCAGSSSAAGQE